MIEQLFNLIQNESEKEIINNPVISEEHNNHAVGLATDSIFSGLQGELANGGLKNVLGMFTKTGDTSANNPLVGGIINNFVGGLMHKLGIDNQSATGVASSLIPGILKKFVKRTNDPNDTSFDINGIIGSLMGGGSAQGSPVQVPGAVDDGHGGGVDFGGILKNLGGGALDSNHDGSLGLDDLSGLIAKATGGNQQSSESGQTSGGIMDILKGFMK